MVSHCSYVRKKYSLDTQETWQKYLKKNLWNEIYTVALKSYNTHSWGSRRMFSLTGVRACTGKDWEGPISYCWLILRPCVIKTRQVRQSCKLLVLELCPNTNTKSLARGRSLIGSMHLREFMLSHWLTTNLNGHRPQCPHTTNNLNFT